MFTIIITIIINIIIITIIEIGVKIKARLRVSKAYKINWEFYLVFFSGIDIILFKIFFQN